MTLQILVIINTINIKDYEEESTIFLLKSIMVHVGTSLVAQCIGLCTPSAGGPWSSN